MILTCPNCSSRFSIDSAMLGEKGRKVKCSTCEEKWFQDPPEEELAAETVVEDVEAEQEQKEPNTDVAAEPEAIEEAVEQPIEEPQPEVVKKALEAAAEKKVEKVKITKEVKLAIAASVLFFAVTLAYFLMNSVSIMSKNPSAQAFYGLFGIQMDVPGVGLVFDRVTAQENGTVIKISGNITNLESEEKIVPLIEASITDAEGGVIEQWMIVPHETIMKSEQTQHFKNEHPTPHGVHFDHANVSVRFVLSSADVAIENNEHGTELKDTDVLDPHDAEAVVHHEGDSHENADNHSEPEHHDTGHEEPKEHH